MKRILRSIIECDAEVSQENLVRNFMLLQEAVDADQFTVARNDDASIYKFVRAYLRQHAEMPALPSVMDHFARANNLEAVERCKSLPAERPYARTNFLHLLRSLQTEQLNVRAISLLEKTGKIITKGEPDERTKEPLEGFDDAVRYFIREAQSLRIDEHVPIHSDIRQDGDKVRQMYLDAEADKSSALGILTGIPQIDESCGGVKKGELWLHAAYTAHLKTTFALNWAYTAVTRFQKNVVYISLEMPLEQIRRQVYTLHSANHRFKQMKFKSLDTMLVQRGLLTEEEREFFLEYVVRDFSENPNYGIFEVFHPDRKWNLRDIQSHLEILEREFEISMVVIDHGLLLEPTEENRNSNYSVAMNSVVDDAKRLALTFNRNAGLPVVMLWQMSRSGMQEATKHDGVYDLTALNWASACEKTSDVVTATFLGDEQRRNGMVKFSHLKNRDNRLFEPTLAHVHFPCRKIVPLVPNNHGGYEEAGLDAHMNNEDVPL